MFDFNINVDLEDVAISYIYANFTKFKKEQLQKGHFGISLKGM